MVSIEDSFLTVFVRNVPLWRLRGRRASDASSFFPRMVVGRWLVVGRWSLVVGRRLSSACARSAQRGAVPVKPPLDGPANAAGRRGAPRLRSAPERSRIVGVGVSGRGRSGSLAPSSLAARAAARRDHAKGRGAAAVAGAGRRGGARRGASLRPIPRKPVARYLGTGTVGWRPSF